MKKKWKIALLASFVIVTIAFGAQRIIATQDKVVLAKEEVKAMVEKQYKGTIESMELTSEDVYTILFSNDKGKYELLMNSYTGEVIGLEEKELKPTSITEEEAKARAKEQVDGEVISIKLEGDMYVVEVQKKDNSGTEVVKVNQQTGKVVSHEQTKPAIKFTEEEAKQIARNHVVGGTVLSIALIDSQEGPVYNMAMKQGTSDVDVRIHAIKGNVLLITKKHQESNDDDADDDKPKQQPNTEQKPPSNQPKPPPQKQPTKKQPNNDDNDDNDDDKGDDGDDDN